MEKHVTVMYSPNGNSISDFDIEKEIQRLQYLDITSIFMAYSTYNIIARLSQLKAFGKLGFELEIVNE